MRCGLQHGEQSGHVVRHRTDSHTVLGERAGLIRADGGGTAEGLDSFKVLDQALLDSHALGSEGEAHSDGGQKTLRYVGDNDTDEKDNSVKPIQGIQVSIPQK